jgi:hypothetical protein
MSKIRMGASAVLGAAAIILGTTAAAVPAPALASPASGWLGQCQWWHDNATAGGWCDGNGPAFKYYTVAWCYLRSNPNVTYSTTGPTRWAGDRRESYAYCSTRGGLLESATLYVTYNNAPHAAFSIV